MASSPDILSVRDLRVWFPIRKGVFARTVGWVKAVDGVSFEVHRGETLAIVGESGSGKSTLARTVSGLVRPTSGSYSLDGRFAMVFQDPLASLNPRMTVRSTLEEILRLQGALSCSAEELMDMTGLEACVLDRYPHEFSGGQRQRICIARSIAAAPELLICDEAVSALDLSVRATVLELLERLKDKLSLSLLFITHDLSVVRHIADRVLVMYRGKVVEQGDCTQVLERPRDEYTKALVAAVPRLPAS